MSESPAPKPAAPTFESGARAMNEALQTKGVEAYFADASDPLHKAFIAKAAVHSGPGGRPLIGEEAEKAIDSHYDTPRSGRSLAYIHVPFCETRCLYCMFYQNPWKEEATTEYAKQLVKEAPALERPCGTECCAHQCALFRRRHADGFFTRRYSSGDGSGEEISAARKRL